MKTIRSEALREVNGLMELYEDAALLHPAIVGIHQAVAAEVYAALAVAYCAIKNIPDDGEIDNEITEVDIRVEDPNDFS